MKYAARVMAAQRTGSIINVASVNGTRTGLGGHYYSAAKAASIHLTRCAAVQLGEKGIRVNSLSPGMIATGAFGKAVGMQPDEADENPEHAEAAIGSLISRWQPLPFVGRADDIAQAALFLASDASRFMTGHNLVVDGGITAGWPIAAVRPATTATVSLTSKKIIRRFTLIATRGNCRPEYVWRGTMAGGQSSRCSLCRCPDLRCGCEMHVVQSSGLICTDPRTVAVRGVWPVNPYSRSLDFDIGWS
jgi:hypothetical protein